MFCQEKGPKKRENKRENTGEPGRPTSRVRGAKKWPADRILGIKDTSSAEPEGLESPNAINNGFRCVHVENSENDPPQTCVLDTFSPKMASKLAFRASMAPILQNQRGLKSQTLLLKQGVLAPHQKPEKNPHQTCILGNFDQKIAPKLAC